MREDVDSVRSCRDDNSNSAIAHLYYNFIKNGIVRTAELVGDCHYDRLNQLVGQDSIVESIESRSIGRICID